MILCEFCLLDSLEDVCRVGLNIPKTMKCHQFAPGIDRFCAKPTDFVSPNQIVEMAKFFGLERTELKKVKIIAERRVADISQARTTLTTSTNIGPRGHRLELQDSGIGKTAKKIR